MIKTRGFHSLSYGRKHAALTAVIGCSKAFFWLDKEVIGLEVAMQNAVFVQ